MSMGLKLPAIASVTIKPHEHNCRSASYVFRLTLGQCAVTVFPVPNYQSVRMIVGLWVANYMTTAIPRNLGREGRDVKAVSELAISGLLWSAQRTQINRQRLLMAT